jgi:hypothetical protein
MRVSFGWRGDSPVGRRRHRGRFIAIVAFIERYVSGLVRGCDNCTGQISSQRPM